MIDTERMSITGESDGPFFELSYDHFTADFGPYEPARVLATDARASLGDKRLGWAITLSEVDKVPGPGVGGWMWDAQGAALALLGRLVGAPWAWV